MAHRLPAPRGPLSAFVVERLAGRPRALDCPPPVDGALDPLGDDDLQLALYVCYEQHYHGFDGVDAAWEWEPSLLAFRSELEAAFERALHDEVGPTEPARDTAAALGELVSRDDGPCLSRYIERLATIEQVREFLVHRSAYQLKEADPHTWAIPRLTGAPKAALVEIQADEYGSGHAERMHAALFRDALEAVGLDGSYGAYLDLVPGVTLATVNLISLLGLHRRRRGALVGHLAAFEMTSSLPNRRYGNALRRLGLDAPAATAFFDEHVEADAVHETVAAHDLAGALAVQEPVLAADILFGARALLTLDRRFAEHLLGCWEAGASSLRAPAGEPLAV